LQDLFKFVKLFIKLLHASRDIYKNEYLI